MPINYLQLQPQITEYCHAIRDQIAQRPEKVNTAIALLHQFAQELLEGRHSDLSADLSHSTVKRGALPAYELVDQVFKPGAQENYCILASDGSQITSTHHDALPVSLVNTATVFLHPGSGNPPVIKRQSEFIRDQDGAIATDFLHEQFVNTTRDVREMQVLANYPNRENLPLLVLGDGPLELFQEPHSGEEHQALFNAYLQALDSLVRKGRIAAGYTDKPRADLVIKTLTWIYQSDPAHDINGITDLDIFSQVLKAGERSAILQLHSPSANAYSASGGLYFFYLNVGSATLPWIVRVEITGVTASQPDAVSLLQHALLQQCALMSARPYPYILHRAHEEAVVSYDERENVLDMLSHRIRELGAQPAAISNKLDAKELGKRTRLK